MVGQNALIRSIDLGLGEITALKQQIGIFRQRTDPVTVNSIPADCQHFTFGLYPIAKAGPIFVVHTKCVAMVNLFRANAPFRRLMAE